MAGNFSRRNRSFDSDWTRRPKRVRDAVETLCNCFSSNECDWNFISSETIDILRKKFKSALRRMLNLLLHLTIWQWQLTFPLWYRKWRRDNLHCPFHKLKFDWMKVDECRIYECWIRYLELHHEVFGAPFCTNFSIIVATTRNMKKNRKEIAWTFFSHNIKSTNFKINIL